jgi:WD40 repeat protein
LSRKIFSSPPTPAIAESVLALAAALLLSVSVRSQVESVENAPQNWVWLNQAQAEGHLALNYSPAGAFSPDGSTLAVVGENKVLLMNLGNGGVRKVLRPRLENTADLQFQSANFLDPNHLLLLGVGLIQAKGEKPRGTTPLLAFQWDIDQDALSGKVNAVGSGGGFAPPVYFPLLRHLVLYKDGQFVLWNAATGQGGRINIPTLTRQPRVYDFSFDGHWLLLAQLETSSTADPLVVRLRDHQFVDSLRGHRGTVLNIAFSRDNQKVATTCEDGKIRIWSVSEWKLLQTLAGHQGPVHWADFSPDGKWLASAGEDATVRIWSVEDGKLLQTLEKARAPVLTVAFSADAKYLAASTERTVLIWKREAG